MPRYRQARSPGSAPGGSDVAAGEYGEALMPAMAFLAVTAVGAGRARHSRLPPVTAWAAFVHQGR